MFDNFGQGGTYGNKSKTLINFYGNKKNKQKFILLSRKIAGGKGKHMEKMILADKTELEIQAGGSLGTNVVVVPDFADLKTVAEALTKEGNLDTVQYKTNEQVTGEYTDMKLETPLFKSVDYTQEKKVTAVFGIREKTELEKEVDEIKAQQAVRDGAILDLAEMVGGEA